MHRKQDTRMNENTHLLVRLEHVAFEHVGGAISSDVAEDLEVLRIVRDIEDPEAKTKQKS